ncbi:MAG: hypothetical protein WBW48_09930 [Anaerolineae bacterium]
MTKTLSDAWESIERFILESGRCAGQGCGFAAMLTVFPVILAVSGAVGMVSGLPSIEQLLRAFVSRMVDKTSWLVAPVTNLSDDDIGAKLAEVRNGLAHQLSLPDDVYLRNTIAEAIDTSKKYPDKYVISTVEFVDVVGRTVRCIIKDNPTVTFDPGSVRWPPRGPGLRVTFEDGSSGSISISQNLQSRPK